jgi:hypothetical protein
LWIDAVTHLHRCRGESVEPVADHRKERDTSLGQRQGPRAVAEECAPEDVFARSRTSWLIALGVSDNSSAAALQLG